MNPGTLYILPNSLGGPVADILPPQVAKVAQQLDGLIAESDRGGRRFLEQFQGLKRAPHQIPIALLNEHTKVHGPEKAEALDWLLEPLLKGETWGLVSDAGLPCLADPGSALVARARQRGIAIHVLSGPSAPLLALLASGLPAQKFVFHGYAPKEPEARQSWVQGQLGESITHLCIEAPYRNAAMLETLIQQLPAESLLGLVLDVTLPSEEVLVTTVSQWRERLAQGKVPADLKSRPAVFLFVPRGQKGRPGGVVGQERSGHPDARGLGPKRSDSRPLNDRGSSYGSSKGWQDGARAVGRREGRPERRSGEGPGPRRGRA
jgi:16S rRNA (cytidine1402-2'-O)-methyltransferase